MEPFVGVNTVELLQAGMKTAQMNHRLIANNIANVDTPNYNPVEMDFQGTLRAVIEGRERIGLRRTHPRHLDAERLITDMGALAGHSKNDYNKVDLEHEMAKLDQNRGRFVSYSALLDKRFTQLRETLTNMR